MLLLARGDAASRPKVAIDARDLAEWTIRMAESHTTGTFNATGPAEPLTMREMLTAAMMLPTKLFARGFSSSPRGETGGNSIR